MTISESEAPYMVMNITTDKHKAVCLALGIPVDSTGDTIADAAVDKLSLLEIYHRAYGWLSVQLFKHDERKAKVKRKTS